MEAALIELNLAKKHYKIFLEEIKSKILSARISAARTISKEAAKLYWDIGKAIVDRQIKHGWGKSVVERLAVDLKREFGINRGFSVQNLWYMRQVFLEYKGNPILQQLVGELPWGHNFLIGNMKKLSYQIKIGVLLEGEE